MSAERSAGLVLYRRGPNELEIFIAHMGGPFWARKDAAAWSIPKGLYLEGEDPLTAAFREFEEEIGTAPPATDYRLLGDFRYSSGKVITVFAGETDAPVEFAGSNTFELEWPPRSGRLQLFPEVDAARWVGLAEARVKLVKGQVPVLEALIGG